MKAFNMLKYNGLFSAACLGVLALPLLGGCAAGPDFKEPAAPTVSSYGERQTPEETARTPSGFGGAQRFVKGGDVPAAWWRLYSSKELSDLVEKAIAGNASLEASRAALRAAGEMSKASMGPFFPSITGSASDSRSKAAGASAEPFTLYNTSVAVSYAPDIFGASRRALEAAEAAEDGKRFEMEAAYLTLTGNVVTAAVQEASLREQIAATKEIIAAQEKQLGLMNAQLAAGALARASVLQQEQLVAASKTALPPLEQQLAATRHMMAVLIGRFPAEGVPAEFTLSDFTLPRDVPLSLPSKLVAQRPDIRAARAALEAANAEIGLATAAMLPQVTLTGSYGISAGRIADMFTPGTAVWGLAAGLAQTIFKGGELMHTRNAKEALFDEAAARYRATVLAAFQNVADSLKALEMDALTLKAQNESERAARAALAATRAQHEAGAVGALALLQAQSAYQTAKIGLIKAQAARLADTAALYQALGGGWWNRASAEGGR